MSPIRRKSAEGLPIFYLQDIPPVASGGPAVREPRIYFGQGADTYVIVKGSTPEFDYPKGKDNVYAAYDGADGLPQLVDHRGEQVATSPVTQSWRRRILVACL